MCVPVAPAVIKTTVLEARCACNCPTMVQIRQRARVVLDIVIIINWVKSRLMKCVHVKFLRSVSLVFEVNK
jgi:hypothetical protein